MLKIENTLVIIVAAIVSIEWAGGISYGEGDFVYSNNNGRVGYGNGHGHGYGSGGHGTNNALSKIRNHWNQSWSKFTPGKTWSKSWSRWTRWTSPKITRQWSRWSSWSSKSHSKSTQRRREHIFGGSGQFGGGS